MRRLAAGWAIVLLALLAWTPAASASIKSGTSFTRSETLFSPGTSENVVFTTVGYDVTVKLGACDADETLKVALKRSGGTIQGQTTNQIYKLGSSTVKNELTNNVCKSSVQFTTYMPITSGQVPVCQKKGACYLNFDFQLFFDAIGQLESLVINQIWVTG